MSSTIVISGNKEKLSIFRGGQQGHSIMIFIQLTGLSGAGKTTIANSVKTKLEAVNVKVEIIDGDAYRKTICKDLGKIS
ncbi:MAG: adenylyl-sulfate kinase [Mucilaginibacter sp.]